MGIRTITFDIADRDLFGRQDIGALVRDACQRHQRGEFNLDYAYKVSFPKTRTIRCGRDEDQYLIQLNEGQDCSVAKTLVALIRGSVAKHADDDAPIEIADQQTHDKVEAMTVDYELLDINNQHGSETQRYLLEQSINAANLGKIAICEASTGTGKGRVIAAAAQHYEKLGRVVVAAPTYAILEQLYDELMGVANAHNGVRPVIIRGRGEYVSAAACLEIAHSLPDGIAKPMLDWLDTTTSFLVDDLVAACPAAPISELTLAVTAADKSDPGYAAYLECRERADHERIVLCTHAMLTLDGFSKIKTAYEAGKLLDDSSLFSRIGRLVDSVDEWDGVLGDYKYLLVDEAHQLESISISMSSAQLPLRLVSQFASSKERGIINAAAAAFQNEYRGADFYLNANHKPTLKPLLESFTKVRDRKNCPDELKDRLRFFLGSSKAWEAGNPIYEMIFRFSPKRKWPSLIVRRKNQKTLLGLLMGRVDGGALFSATIYSPHKREDWSASAFLNGIGMLDNQATKDKVAKKVLLSKPQRPRWVVDPVTIHYEKALTPPKGDGSESEDSRAIDTWHRDLAINIQDIALNAKGGMLVLCTSYATVSAISEHMRATGLADRVIIGSVGTNYAQLKRLYMQQYKAGQKPIWIATGRAWTGINIADYDVDAKDDYSLIDLVIPRMPFEPPINGDSGWGFGRSAHHFSIRLKQGIGRLVRREGSPKKNLWVLDKRAVAKNPQNAKGYAWFAQKIFKDYAVFSSTSTS